MARISRNRGIIISRSLFVCILLTVCSAGVHAQLEDTRNAGKHMLGIKAGQNLSWLKLEPVVQQSAVLGPTFGISYTYMGQHFGGVLMEVNYIQYGWEEVFMDSTINYSRIMNYVEFPILSNFVIGKKKTHLKFQGGVKVSVFLDDEEMEDVDDQISRYHYGLEIEDQFELGLAFGLSVSQVFTFGEFQVDARYNNSLSNLFEPAKDLTELLYSQNQSISLSIHYMFWLK